jgi:hypothetical protein
MIDLDELHAFPSESPRACVVAGGEDHHPSYAGVESVGDDAVVEPSSCGDPRADPLADPPAPPRDHAKEESFPTTNEPACVNIVQKAKRREVRSDQRDVFCG